MQQKTPASPFVHLSRMASMIPVSDVPRAVGFYTAVLGFRKTFENGTPVGFVILKKNAAGLHLALDRNHEAAARNVAHLMVEDAAAFHEHLEHHAVRIIKALRDADFGLRCFVFADLDGNRIDVGQARPCRNAMRARPPRALAEAGAPRARRTPANQ